VGVPPERNGAKASGVGWGLSFRKDIFMRIAYQGEPGAFSEAAARLVAPDAALVPCRTFEDVFTSVESGPATHGVLPVENSVGGSIHRNYDLLLEHNLPILAEVEMTVVHHLLALPGTSIDRVRKVYSHPQGLAQCERYLRTLTGVEIVATYDTAGSAKLIADQRLEDVAAIASARAGQVFGLATLASSIQDFDDNLTRFIVIGPSPLHDRPADKTSIVFSLPNEPGSLFKALSAFALRGVDLTKLESRPIPGRPWEYLFYVDLAGDELACTRALSHLAEFASTLRTLGSYESWKRREASTRASTEAIQ
jgi:prephenate dehydratase